MRSYKQCKSTGFSMIELLITMSILVVLLAIAAPGFQEMIKRDRVASSSNQILTAINYARTQAITQNTRVTICPSNDVESCISNPTASDWNSQWIVFTDSGTSNGNGTVGTVDTIDASDLSDPANWQEEILRVYDALPNQDYIYADDAIKSYISFIGDGSPRDGDYIEINSTKSKFAYCPQKQATPDARIITISRAGRASVFAYDENNAADKTFITAICDG